MVLGDREVVMSGEDENDTGRRRSNGTGTLGSDSMCKPDFINQAP